MKLDPSQVGENVQENVQRWAPVSILFGTHKNLAQNLVIAH